MKAVLDDFLEISSEITVKNKLSNRMNGSFILYSSSIEELESTLLIKKPSGDDLNLLLSVRAPRELDLNVTLDIKYRGNDYIDTEIEAIAGSYLDSIIEVRPHNQMYGKFELLEAPKIEVGLEPIADATTRSRSDLQTINYGDTRSMLTGKSQEEEFKSFIQFSSFTESIPDLKYLEGVKLRLYYINFPAGSNIELHQPNTLWREMGVTYANQPFSIELLSSQYTNNLKERYIEFDLLEVALKWQDFSLDNLGFIVTTSSNEAISFFTRESDKSPLLIVNYISSKVYSIGRSELEAGLFINGKGQKDIAGTITVKSDVGLDYLISNIYVHRKEDPLDFDTESYIAASRPEINSSLIIAKRTQSELDALLTIRSSKNLELDSAINVNNPDLISTITVDPKISLSSLLTVSKKETSSLDAFIIVNQRDLGATIDVSKYKKHIDDIDAEITVKSGEEEFLESSIYISRQDLNGVLTVRAFGEEFLDSSLEIPFYNSQDSMISISRPDVPSMLMVKYIDQIDGFLEIKERNYLESVIDVKNINELESFITVKQINETESEIIINQPDLSGYITPRIEGIEDLSVLAMIRKRDVSDLNSIMVIRGKGNRNYVFII